MLFSFIGPDTCSKRSCSMIFLTDRNEADWPIVFWIVLVAFYEDGTTAAFLQLLGNYPVSIICQRWQTTTSQGHLPPVSPEDAACQVLRVFMSKGHSRWVKATQVIPDLILIHRWCFSSTLTPFIDHKSLVDLVGKDWGENDISTETCMSFFFSISYI